MDERIEPSMRKCSTSSSDCSTTSSSSNSSSAGSIALLDEDHDGTAVARATVADDAAAVAANKAPDSEIHTDRDDCSSTDESNGLDSPSGLKSAAGSVYDFELDGTDHPPPCNPFVVGDADLTKVARKQLRMIREVDVAVCHLNHTNTIISKILSCKYLRRWENHQIRIQDDYISSNTVNFGILDAYRTRGGRG